VLQNTIQGSKTTAAPMYVVQVRPALPKGTTVVLAGDVPQEQYIIKDFSERTNDYIVYTTGDKTNTQQTLRVDQVRPIAPPEEGIDYDNGGRTWRW
jgi:hypothetical protein